MIFKTLWLPRRGNTPDQFEDAFAGSAETGRFAVADGASESCFADLWARALVESFVHQADCDPEELSAFMPAAQRQWLKDLATRTIPWYAEDGTQRGAFATYLGLVVDATAEPSWHWRAAAVGDSCLFHVRHNELCCVFPVEASSQFDKRPDLLGSRTPMESVESERVLKAHGEGCPGDRLLLMTDALAQYCLAAQEAGDDSWSRMASLLASPAHPVDFEAWIDEQRDGGRLQNDDVALLAVDL